MISNAPFPEDQAEKSFDLEMFNVSGEIQHFDIKFDENFDATIDYTDRRC